MRGLRFLPPAAVAAASSAAADMFLGSLAHNLAGGREGGRAGGEGYSHRGRFTSAVPGSEFQDDKKGSTEGGKEEREGGTEGGSIGALIEGWEKRQGMGREGRGRGGRRKGKGGCGEGRTN